MCSLENNAIFSTFLIFSVCYISNIYDYNDEGLDDFVRGAERRELPETEFKKLLDILRCK